MNRLILFVLCALIARSSDAQTPAFSQDSAYANLQVLAGKIGPRPMGSPAEQQALAFAVERFKAYGCDEAYVMPMTVAEGVNTKSGVAVGIKRGATGRIIVLGGHIDSAGPEIPGANDDGSGAASVIELARVICARPNASTVVFCCWGGEEEGLRGSTYFVDHFAALDSVVLMLQIDMADGSGSLEIDPDASYQKSAPSWLVSAAYDIFYGDLDYEGMYYPTQSATLNYSGKGGTGSDHIPFIEKGIPALDFTSDVSYPIHTPLDNLRNFSPAGLKRSGDLLVRLFERFDGGTPPRSTDQYWLVEIGHMPIFVQHWMLWTFLVLVTLLAIGAAVLSVRRRVRFERAEHIRWSGLKLLLCTVIIQTLIWLSPRVVSVISGYRFPWVNNFTGFVILGILAGLVGVWLCLRMVQRLRLSPDPAPYYLRAIILLLLMTAALLFINIEMTVYALVPLLLLVIAMLTRNTWVKTALLIVAPVMLLRLVFFEALGLIQRTLALVVMDGAWKVALYDMGFVGFFVLLSIPLVYAFAAVYRDSRLDLFWLRSFRTSTGLALSLGLFVVLAIYLSFRPVYDELWQENVRIQQRYVMGSDSSTVTITDAEYLRGLHLAYDGRDTLLKNRINSFALQPSGLSAVRWCTIDATSEERPSEQGDSTARAIERRIVLHSVMRPFMVNVRYRGTAPLSLESPWVVGGRRMRFEDSPRNKSLSWYAFPDTVLVIPVTLTLQPGQSVTEEVEVVFDTLAYPLTAAKPFTYITPRTIVVREDSLKLKRGDENMARGTQ